MGRLGLRWIFAGCFFFLSLGATADIVEGPGGVKLDLDMRMKFPLPSPDGIPLIASKQKTLDELIKEGEKNWYFFAPLEGEPFGVPEELFDGVFGKFKDEGIRHLVFDALEKIVPFGLVHNRGEDLPRGLVRTQSDLGRIVTQNCSACHSGMVNGKYYSGVSNKWYDQKNIIKFARKIMEQNLPSLEQGGEETKDLFERTKKEYAKLERYDALYGTGCELLSPGLVTGARIWQISSMLLHDPAQLMTPAGLDQFKCGETKSPPLNTLKFRNLFFWDGTVNTQWVAHWPMFDFFGFIDFKRWEKKIVTPEIQSVDAFLVFGTKSPSWKEVTGHSPDAAKAARGYQIFHKGGLCSSCHGTYDSQGWLKAFKPQVISLDKIGTQPNRALAAYDDLFGEFTKYGWVFVPRIQGYAQDYPQGYAAYPLCSSFMNYPYLHMGSVANVHELLLPEEKRSSEYWMVESMDTKNVGFWTEPELVLRRLIGQRVVHKKFPFEYVKGHSGSAYGTDLSEKDHWDLIEYFKTLRCP